MDKEESPQKVERNLFGLADKKDGDKLDLNDDDDDAKSDEEVEIDDKSKDKDSESQQS